MTTSALIDVCLEDFPLLPLHACRNQKGTTFAAVMRNTSVPHMLEHLIVYLQVKAEDARQRSVQGGEVGANNIVITGSTQWSLEDDLLAQVTVSFADDIVALAACKEALTYVNRAFLAIEQ